MKTHIVQIVSDDIKSVDILLLKLKWMGPLNDENKLQVG